MTKEEYIDRECSQRCALHMHCGWRHSHELCPSMREFSKGYDAAVEQACKNLVSSFLVSGMPEGSITEFIFKFRDKMK